MTLSKPGLPGQQRDAERSPLYAAQQFQAESFVHLSKVHMWKIRHQQWRGTVQIFLWQSYQGSLALVLSVRISMKKH
jgi:hypothetical protein